MALSDSKGLLTYLAPVFLLLCCRSGSSIFFDEFGVVRPNDPRPFVGENLTLYCNLTKHLIHENSSRLYFSRSGERIPSKYEDVISSRTIRLQYPITKPEDEGLFVCWLDRIGGGRETIGTQHVEADYRPVKVTSVDCIVYNWKNMTCRWDLRRDYHHMENIKVSLIWTISGEQKDCPQLTPTSCVWSGDYYSPADTVFLPGSQYIMTVEVLNLERRVSEKSSPPFKISTQDLVKPDPVQNLRWVEKNATCLKLGWTHSDRMNRKLAKVEYFSEWNNGNWTVLPLKPFVRGDVYVTICGLTPFSDYTIRIGVWPQGRSGQPMGFCSDLEYMTVRTDASVPEVGPKMCAGCFTDIPSPSNQRKVIIYWQHIPWPLRYSTIRGYHLHPPDSSINSTVASCNFTDANSTSCLLALPANRAYTLQLYAVTLRNELSRNFSTIQLPSLAEKPSVPTSFVVETWRQWTANRTGKFYLRWDGKEDSSSYLVTWCRGSRTNQMCDDEPRWVELPGSATHYTLSVKSKGKHHPKKRENQEDYLVGVSRQVRRSGRFVSSGIVWAKCIYLREEVPAAPENVNFAEVQMAGSLSVTWDRAECSRNNVYITHYVVYYCKTDANNKCKGKPSKMNVTQENSVLLNNLDPGMYYRVAIAAVSEWGEGQHSQPPIFAKVISAEQVADTTNYGIIGVVLAVFLVIIFILIGMCKLRRHYLRNRDKFGSLGNLPPLPHGRSFTEKEPSNFKNRPLPSIPPQPSSSGATTTTTLGFSSDISHCNNNRNRNMKHKSITSETSLLGHEDTVVDDDSRRRHRSGTNSTSEKSKLLPPESKVAADKQPSKYDSDSGTESRYSSDHDYASVDSGGAGSGKSPQDSGSGIASGGGNRSGNSYAGKDAFQLGASLALGQKGGSEMSRKLEPNCLPPPPQALKPGYLQASLATPDMSLFHGLQEAGSGDSERHPLLTTFGTSQPDPHSLPAHQGRIAGASGPGNPVPSTAYEPGAGSHLIDDRTLPLRPPGAKPKYIQETELNLLSPTLSVDPYASSNVPLSCTPPSSAAAVAKLQHPHSRSEAAVLPMVEVLPSNPSGSVMRGYAPRSTPQSGSHGRAGASEGGGRSADAPEPIYSPPWGSNGLISVITDNRPLSEYMLQLPQQYFHEPMLQVHEGPTTEL